jgi:hypothetical protein
MRAHHRVAALAAPFARQRGPMIGGRAKFRQALPPKAAIVQPLFTRVR